MRKLVSLALVLLLCLSLCTPAFAVSINISSTIPSEVEEDPYDFTVSYSAKHEWVKEKLTLQEYVVDRTTEIGTYLAVEPASQFTVSSREDPADSQEISIAVSPYENNGDGVYRHVPDAPQYYLTQKGGFVSSEADLDGVKYGGRVKLAGGEKASFQLPESRFAADCVFRVSIEMYDPDGGSTHTDYYYIKPRSNAPAPAAPPAQSVTAIPTSASVQVDGTNVVFDAYNIDGSNYFKLRDLAYALNGTKNQFEVSWDGAANAISLTSGAPYTPVGGEMAVKDAVRQTAKATNSKVLLDGAELALTAYNIGGNNYFKLRDIGEVLGFSVDWNSAKQMISIFTSQK